jgi:hypothetical protein
MSGRPHAKPAFTVDVAVSAAVRAIFRLLRLVTEGMSLAEGAADLTQEQPGPPNAALDRLSALESAYVSHRSENTTFEENNTPGGCCIDKLSRQWMLEDANSGA